MNLEDLFGLTWWLHGTDEDGLQGIMLDCFTRSSSEDLFESNISEITSVALRGAARGIVQLSKLKGTFAPCNRSRFASAINSHLRSLN